MITGTQPSARRARGGAAFPSPAGRMTPAGRWRRWSPAVRADESANRVASFVHRLLQRCLSHSEAFVCAALMFIGEVAKAHPIVHDLIRGKLHRQQQHVNGSGHHGVAAETIQEMKKRRREGTDKAANRSETYQPAARDPEYSRASTECLWVLHVLMHHTHPTVVQLAIMLLNTQEPALDMHPLDDLTLQNFLEMFVETAHGENDPEGKSKTHRDHAEGLDDQRNEKLMDGRNGGKGVPVFRRAQHVAEIPRLNDPNFLNAAPEHIDVCALFLHRYAHQRQRYFAAQKKAAIWNKKLLLEEGDDEDGGGGGEGRPAVANKLVSSAPSALFGPDATGHHRSHRSGGMDDDSSSPPDGNDDDDASEGDGGDELDWGDAGLQSSDEEEDTGLFGGTGMKRPRPGRTPEEDDMMMMEAGGKDDFITNADEFDSLMEHHGKNPTKAMVKKQQWMDRNQQQHRELTRHQQRGGGRW